MKPYYDEGGITIYCGDSREILPSLVGVDSVVTDPPYGIDYEHGSRKGGVKLGTDGERVIGDDEPFDPAYLLGYPTVVLWGANHYADRLPAARGWLVWDKRDGIAPNDQSDCELAWTNRLTVARLFTRYWNGGGIGEKRWHPTQKPIALMRWCLELVPDAQTILDPYMGSGTTLRAAKDLGRKAIGIELREDYCAIAVERLRQSAFDLTSGDLTDALPTVARRSASPDGGDLQPKRGGYTDEDFATGNGPRGGVGRGEDRR